MRLDQSIVQRVKQFLRSLSASVTQEDLVFLDKYLNTAEEKALFFQMEVADQRHALDVANHVYQAATVRGLGSWRNTVVKAALLHDVGKVKGEVSLLSRILFVLSPSLLSRYHSKAWQMLQDHAQRGAHMAEAFGVEPEVVKLIQEHHSPEVSQEASRLLQEADNLF